LNLEASGISNAGVIDFSLRSYNASTGGSLTSVDTNVTVYFHIEGDLFSTYDGSITLTNGTSCTSQAISTGFASLENITTMTVTAISPSNSSTQNYIQNLVSSTTYAPC
jgi:hypothetical protein